MNSSKTSKEIKNLKRKIDAARREGRTADLAKLNRRLERVHMENGIRRIQ